LCRADGEFVEILRCPTCSHEHFDNGYEGMKQAMGAQLGELFRRNGITAGDIAVAAFGLAGADLPEQIDELNQRVRELGFNRFVLGNDGILGIKTVTGSGICAINGTGTVIVGINSQGAMLQVGGIGPLSGDHAGGSFIMRQGITATHSYFYRLGKNSAMIPAIMGILGVNAPSALPAAISDYRLLTDNMKEIINAVDDAALSGDEVARGILDGVGVNVGEGACGCIRNLGFDGEITIVKAGSIWNKIKYPGMIDRFVETVRDNAPNHCRFVLSESPPALGAIFWAKEIYDGKIDLDYREKMLGFLNLEKYDKVVNSYTGL